MKPKELWKGVYKFGRQIATLNLTPGMTVYGEKLVRLGGKEYRIWDPYRSKLAAAILKGLRNFPFEKGSCVLYLGASTGTTSSHISDVCRDGAIYCVEISKRMMRDLLFVCCSRTNMIPILADAAKPESYAQLVAGVDVVYQDLAQLEQAGILLRNVKRFKPEHCLLAIKARSIDVVKKPSEVFEAEVRKLRAYGLKVLEEIRLEPYDKAHELVVCEC